MDPAESADLSPVIAQDPMDLRISMSSIVHWADSHEVRRRVMAAAEFPLDDMAMFLVVNQLSYRGAMRPSALAAALGTGRANLTKITHRLVDARLAVRVPDPDDERSVLVALTSTGREIGERIMAHARSTLDTAVQGWSARDVADLRRLLARLAQETVAELRPAPKSR